MLAAICMRAGLVEMSSERSDLHANYCAQIIIMQTLL